MFERQLILHVMAPNDTRDDFRLPQLVVERRGGQSNGRASRAAIPVVV